MVKRVSSGRRRGTDTASLQLSLRVVEELHHSAALHEALHIVRAHAHLRLEGAPADQLEARPQLLLELLAVWGVGVVRVATGAAVLEDDVNTSRDRYRRRAVRLGSAAAEQVEVLIVRADQGAGCRARELVGHGLQCAPQECAQAVLGTAGATLYVTLILPLTVIGGHTRGRGRGHGCGAQKARGQEA